MQRIVEFLKDNNAPPQYDQYVQQQIDHAAREEEDDEEREAGDGDQGEDSELYEQALDVALRYGWIDLGLSYDNASVPELKIYGYAYDDTGAEILTGALILPAAGRIPARGV